MIRQFIPAGKTMTFSQKVYGFVCLSPFIAGSSTWQHDSGLILPLTPSRELSGDRPWESLSFTNGNMAGQSSGLALANPTLAPLYVVIAQTPEDALKLPAAGNVPFPDSPPSDAQANASGTLTAGAGTNGVCNLYMDPGFSAAVVAIAISNASAGPAGLQIQIEDDVSTYSWEDTVPAGANWGYEVLGGCGNVAAVTPTGLSTVQLQTPVILPIPRPLRCLTQALEISLGATTNNLLYSVVAWEL